MIRAERVLEDVVRIRVEHPGTYIGHVNLYLIELDDGRLLVDSGFRQTAGELVEELRRLIEGSRLETVLLTHIHNDHTGGAREVATAFGPKVRMHQRDIDVIRFMRETVEGGGKRLKALGLDDPLTEEVLGFFRLSLIHI